MAREEINVTNFDHQSLKDELVVFLKSTGEFDDFDFEGSTLNTMIDLLVRNGHFDAFLANMLANESFIQSAQLRQNVVAHAEKLSYQVRSTTASRLLCTIEVVPSSTSGIPTSVVLEEGTPFIGSVGDTSYSFTNIEPYTLTFNSSTQSFRATNVELFQGSLITNSLLHLRNEADIIPNTNCDTSTLTVVGQSDGEARVYNRARSIDQLGSTSSVYFLSENTRGQYELSFGRDILGNEPDDNSIVQVTYIATEREHANGVTSLVSGSLIGGYANIQIDVTTKSYGGSGKEDIEDVRFFAPKAYQAQDRGLTDSDYIPLLKQQFSFIRNAISWGGEKNDPPVYGSVFISILSEEGGLITNAVKQQMEEFLSDYNVGSITPTITDPSQYGIDLSIAFAYDNRLTSKGFNALSIEVQNVANQYADQLFNFGQYYNEAYLNEQIMSIPGITSLNIDKVQFYDLEVLRFENPVYTINFENELEPGSIEMTGFEIASDASDHKLYDDEEGIIYVSYINQFNQTVEMEVGTVDYETGSIEFSINMLQSDSTVRLYVQTVADNFYVKRNMVVYINSLETSLLDIKDRTTQILR